MSAPMVSTKGLDRAVRWNATISMALTAFLILSVSYDVVTTTVMPFMAKVVVVIVGVLVADRLTPAAGRKAIARAQAGGVL